MSMNAVECTPHFVLHFALLASEELFLKYKVDYGKWTKKSWRGICDGWKKYGKVLNLINDIIGIKSKLQSR